MPLRAYTSRISDQGPFALATVDLTYADLIAPAGVAFEVQNIPSAVYHFGGYQWTFTDNESGEAFGYLQDEHPFKATGKSFRVTSKASRIFATPGTKSWSVTMRYQGYERTISGTITIDQHENDAIADADTYYVSTSGTFPSGAANTYTDLDTALAAATGSAHIRLRSGETFIHSGLEYTRLGQKIVLSAYDTGTQPKITVDPVDTGHTFDIVTQHLKVFGVEMFGNYDPTTESTTDASVRRGIYSRAYPGSSGRTVLVYDVVSHGLSHNVYTGESDADYNSYLFNHGLVFLSELHTPNRSNFALFGGAETIVIEGCNLDSDADALGGGHTRETPSTNRHGPTRIERCLRYISQCNNMFSNFGWVDPAGIAGHQGCQRLLTSSNPECESVTSQCVMEGGSPIISHESSAGADWARDWIGRHTYQSNYIIATANVPQCMIIGHPGTSVFNNIFYHPNVPDEKGAFQGFVAPRAVFSNPRGEDLGHAPVMVRGNTFVTLCENAKNNINTGNFRWTTYESAWNDAGFRELDIGDNIEYAPNMTGLSDAPAEDYGPLDMTTVITPKYKGLRYWDQLTLDTTYATPTEGAALFQPQAGSSAIGAASVRLELDFWGNPRSETTSIGAFDGAA